MSDILTHNIMTWNDRMAIPGCEWTWRLTHTHSLNSNIHFFLVYTIQYLIIFGFFKSNPFFIFVKITPDFTAILTYIHMSRVREKNCCCFYFALRWAIDERFLHVQGILIEFFYFCTGLICVQYLPLFYFLLSSSPLLLVLFCIIQN